MFLGTFEKQLDNKRRIVLPAEFRGDASSVFCFPSILDDCLEGGGQDMYDDYAELVDDIPFGDPQRTALDREIFGKMHKLAFDPAGRIILPDSLCKQFGLDDWVMLVGMRKSFQIWDRDAYLAANSDQRLDARASLIDLSQRRRARQQAARGLS